MKIEDHFKETLHRAVANEPPVLDAWDRFERRVGRSRRWRLVASLAGAAAVIAAAAIVVPQLSSSPVRPIPKITQPPDPYAGWQFASDPVGQWTVRFPRDWRAVSFEGTYDILPPGEIGTAAGKPTFAVYIAKLDEELEPPAAEGDPSVLRGVWSDGRPYLKIDLKPEDKSVVGHTYRIDWRPPCAFETPACDVAPSTLVVQVIEIGNDGRFQRYGETGDLIARSITSGVTVSPEPIPS